MSQRVRNIFLRDSNEVIVGGLYQNGSVTYRNLYEMVEIIAMLNSDFRLYQSEGNRKQEAPRNGLLLQGTVHLMFDAWQVAINPDDGYKITIFGPDAFGYDGRILHPSCRIPDDPRRVSDELLRWHFRQAVLFNVKGAGERIWEFDFPPGTDMIGEIMSGPDGPERMELELGGCGACDVSDDHDMTIEKTADGRYLGYDLRAKSRLRVGPKAERGLAHLSIQLHTRVCATTVQHNTELVELYSYTMKGGSKKWKSNEETWTGSWLQTEALKDNSKRHEKKDHPASNPLLPMNQGPGIVSRDGVERAETDQNSHNLQREN
ncbi:MAG: hypothetical protein M1816_002474 [Peltula sp. TS41687]|nr:MAG: hypothetical protein M1816_002474 [Peltula sp. TS41687]